jgi:hypothetical protein
MQQSFTKAKEQLLAFQAGQITLATIKRLAVIDSLQQP